MYAYFVCCSLSYLWVEEKARCKHIFLKFAFLSFFFFFFFFKNKKKKKTTKNKTKRKKKKRKKTAMPLVHTYVYKFLTKMIPRCKFWSGQVLDEARFQSRGIPLTKPMFDRHKADV